MYDLTDDEDFLELIDIVVKGIILHGIYFLLYIYLNCDQDKEEIHEYCALWK